MKVVIIGAGLSGLGTAIALRKYVPAGQHLEINIYDNTNPDDNADQSRLGAGLGLQANGLHVLNDLDHALREKVYAVGFPCKHFTWKTAGDYLLGREYLDLLPISRLLLINCLQETLPKDAVTYKTKPLVQFEDGSPDEVADLVVGADGIRSTVRHDLFGDDEKYRPNYV
ncbi:FAD/NAD(P)-binding domain-containing protein [Xylariaceae sp. FL0662B]|nr:FAD/NAD(P)-binding domain-containing protein [Xylariaceae sp. FL0662B]